MIVAGMYFAERWGERRVQGYSETVKADLRVRLAHTQRLFLVVGIMFCLIYFAVPQLAQISSIGALFAVGRNFLPLAICIALFRRLKFAEGLSYSQIIAAAISVPLFNLLSSGILADAVTSTVIIAVAALILFETRGSKIAQSAFWLLIGATIFVFLAFNYLQTRTDLRNVLWNKDAQLEQRLVAVGDSISNFRIPDTQQSEDLAFFDMRLNHNAFIGKAVENLKRNPAGFENGATLIYAPVAWVPRFVWQNKPVRGGGALIQKHTGYFVKNDTTFGVGPFFEFFINFGYWGTAILCFGYGFLIRRLEFSAFESFQKADLKKFAAYSLAAIALVSPLATMASVFSALFASIITGYAAIAVLDRTSVGKSSKRRKISRLRVK